MMKWIDVNSGELPPVEQPILCYCPEWSETGYQCCKWNGDVFYYDEQSSDNFNAHVEKWTLFFEAD
jgi:hypothetical protein